MNVKFRHVALLFAAAVILSQTARAQSLDEAMAAAYASNPTLAAARAALRATDEEVPQALSGYRPSMTLNGGYGREAVTSPSSADARQHREPGTLDLALTQPIYRGGRTDAATERAEASVKAERARLTAAEQAVLLNAATAYMNVLRDTAVLDLNTNNEQVLFRQLQATKDRFSVGEVTQTDVHQAEARVSGAHAARIQSEGALQVSRAQFRTVIGDYPGTLADVQAPADVPVDLDDAVKQAGDRNPDVLAAIYDERASTHAVDEISGELLPTVSVSGSASKGWDQGGEDTRSTDYQVMVSVSIPLYESGSVRSRIRGARQTLSSYRQKLEAARRDATESATREWQNLETARAAIASFKDQVDANRTALEGVRREASVGSRTILDVLNAEQEMLDSQVNLVKARRDEIVAVFALKSAVGVLTADALSLPVNRYDPARHYHEVRGKWFGLNSTGDAE